MVETYRPESKQNSPVISAVIWELLHQKLRCSWPKDSSSRFSGFSYWIIASNGGIGGIDQVNITRSIFSILLNWKSNETLERYEYFQRPFTYQQIHMKVFLKIPRSAMKKRLIQYFYTLLSICGKIKDKFKPRWFTLSESLRRGTITNFTKIQTLIPKSSTKCNFFFLKYLEKHHKILFSCKFHESKDSHRNY